MQNANSNLFLEIIDWIEENPNILMQKVCDENNDIKNGAKLTVRESQSALLLSEGKIVETFAPGMHSLSTKNYPIFSQIFGAKYGFNSPFKADVYFFSTKQFVNLKWGTQTPIMMQDSRFGQVRLRAFGTYNLRIIDAAKFLREYAGTFPMLTIFEFEAQIRDFIVAKFSEIIASLGIPAIEITKNISHINEQITPKIAPFFEEFGLEIKNFTIASVSLPDEVSKTFDTVTSMNMVDDVEKLQKFQTAQAIGSANSTMSHAAMDAAAMGVMMSSMMNVQNQKTSQNQDDVVEKLQKLKNLFENGLIDEDEYKAKKSQLLENF